MKTRELKELRIRSVSYVHDPEAMKRWMDIYVNLIKEILLENSEHFK